MSRTDSPTTPTKKNSMLGVGAAALVGSALEWYDFYLYGTAAALVFNRIIFVNSDPVVATLAAFATFAVGYLIRPLGGLIFGRMGDTLGRKRVLVLTLLIMGVATFLMGLTPSYEQIGIWAPIMLIVLRLVQGIGAGAEFGGAAIFSVEHADPRRRGLHGAWPSAGVYLGLLMASGVFAVVTQLPEDQFLAWGWRIPFLLSAVVVIVALIIRLRLAESPAFVAMQSDEHAPVSPVRTVFAQEKTGMLTLFLAQLPQNVVSSINLAFITAYLVGNLQLSASVGPIATTIGTAVTMVLLPVFGALSDRIGRRPVILFGIVFSGIFAFPYFWLIGGGEAPALVVVAIVLSLGLGVGAMFGPQAAYFAELFTGGARFTGLAFSRELAGAVSAGTTPLIAVALVAATGGATWAVSLFIVAACVVGAIAVFFGGETRGRRMSATTVADLKASTGSFER
ncbi:MHS family MFS transporter [Microbacterium sp. kSW2-24]|uniref:MFS transporter n=1 Tax=Microbacterium galbinum TaxID=2851646 RepID=UPI001FFCC4C8|nr:MFS transporter [Microbacterium galbinum]MCK2021472.1 MHS family MFS transporter [Microbacterium galbinum]